MKGMWPFTGNGLRSALKCPSPPPPNTNTKLHSVRSRGKNSCAGVMPLQQGRCSPPCPPVSPHIRAVPPHVDGHVPYQLHAFGVCIRLQRHGKAGSMSLSWLMG